MLPTSRPSILESRHTYHLGSLIGRGGLGEVYSAWFEQPDGTRCACAVKILQSQHLDQADVRERFEQEAILTRKVSGDHPHVVNLWDFDFRDPADPFLVLEHVDGPSLHVIKEQLRGHYSLICLVARDLLSALEHLHESGLIHRDVSPANVLVAPGGIIKLTDLGLAKPIADPLTFVGQGVPKYAAPEVLRQEQQTTASDLYSVGAILHELITGHPPGADVVLPPETPDELEKLTRSLLLANPEHRPSISEAFALLPPDPQDARNLAAIVEGWQRMQVAELSQAATLLKHRISPDTSPTPNQPRRLRRFVLAAAALVLLGVLLLTLSTVVQPEQDLSTDSTQPSESLQSDHAPIEIGAFRDWKNP